MLALPVPHSSPDTGCRYFTGRWRSLPGGSGCSSSSCAIRQYRRSGADGPSWLHALDLQRACTALLTGIDIGRVPELSRAEVHRLPLQPTPDLHQAGGEPVHRGAVVLSQQGVHAGNCISNSCQRKDRRALQRRCRCPFSTCSTDPGRQPGLLALSNERLAPRRSVTVVTHTVCEGRASRLRGPPRRRAPRRRPWRRWNRRSNCRPRRRPPRRRPHPRRVHRPCA